MFYELEKELSRGTKDIRHLDGLTLCIDDVFYNIYVNNNIIEVEEI